MQKTRLCWTAQSLVFLQFFSSVIYIFPLVFIYKTSWSIKVSIAAQKFATSCITDCKGSDITWELRMYIKVLSWDAIGPMCMCIPKEKVKFKKFWYGYLVCLTLSFSTPQTIHFDEPHTPCMCLVMCTITRAQCKHASRCKQTLPL